MKEEKCLKFSSCTRQMIWVYVKFEKISNDFVKKLNLIRFADSHVDYQTSNYFHDIITKIKELLFANCIKINRRNLRSCCSALG